MKRIISFLIIIFLLLPLNTFFVSATPVSDGETEKTAYQTLLEGMLNEEEYIYVYSYGLGKEELRVLMELIFKNEPMLFHCAGSYRYSYRVDTVTAILPNYDISGEDLAEAREFIEREIEYILSTIPNGLDDCETMLYLHDYLALNYHYDKEESDGLSYTIYDMFVQGEGVCMAYALLFDELLTRLGIETRAITSEAIDHMWNEVLVDDNWYEADVTWDDPLPDTFGRVNHVNVLKSHAAMVTNHEDGYEPFYPCTDTAFDEAYWHYIDKPFGFANGEMYMIEDNLIYKLDVHTGEYVEIFTAGEKWWWMSGNSYLNCRIGFGSYHDWLYYNSEYAIMRYNPLTNVEETVYTPEMNEGERIIGLYNKDNEVHYLVSPTLYADEATEYVYIIEENASGEPEPNPDDVSEPNPDESEPDVSEPNPDVSEPNPDESEPDVEPEPEIIYGDVDNDGTVGAVDYLLVKRACFETYTLSPEEKTRGNINKDDKIDSVDYLLIKRIAFGTYSV
ncbi:MAG: hypothetical protein J6Q89_04740 [Clostridia bacterium]|nr:hypothetical protein [Clostridia bacterium]